MCGPPFASTNPRLPAASVLDANGLYDLQPRQYEKTQFVAPGHPECCSSRAGVPERKNREPYYSYSQDAACRTPSWWPSQNSGQAHRADRGNHHWRSRKEAQGHRDSAETDGGGAKETLGRSSKSCQEVKLIGKQTLNRLPVITLADELEVFVVLIAFTALFLVLK